MPFEIHVAYPPGAPGLVWRRVRWTPDARRVVFIGANATGFSPDYTAESLGLSRDGRHLTIATLRRFGSVWLAGSLEGVDAPVRAPAR